MLQRIIVLHVVIIIEVDCDCFLVSLTHMGCMFALTEG